MANATHFDYYQIEGHDASHIFAFSVVFSEHDLISMIRILNRTNFKVLVFNCDPTNASMYGLRSVVHIDSFTSNMIGGKGSFMSYIYLKKKQDYGMIFEEPSMNKDEEETCSVYVLDVANKLKMKLFGSIGRSVET